MISFVLIAVERLEHLTYDIARHPAEVLKERAIFASAVLNYMG